MKVEKVQFDDKVSKYPYLGISNINRVIVLFIKKKTGFCVDIGSSLHDLGEFSSSWSESEFTPFNGTITLSND